MNKEVQYIMQGFLLALLVIVACNIVHYFYHYSENVLPANKSSAVVIDDGGSPNDPVVSSSGSAGNKLFQAYCASCHQIYKRLVEPALIGLEERGPWSDRKQVYAWIHNPARYMKTDPYTASLMKEYNSIMMQAFPSLSEKDIDAILDYIKSTPTPHYSPVAVAFR